MYVIMDRIMEIGSVATTIYIPTKYSVVNLRNTSVNIINSVFEQNFVVGYYGHFINESRFRLCVGSDLSVAIHLKITDAGALKMYVDRHEEDPFFTCEFNPKRKWLYISKNIRYNTMYPLFDDSEGITAMSNVVNKIIYRLADIYGKKKDEEEIKDEFSEQINDIQNDISTNNIDNTLFRN